MPTSTLIAIGVGLVVLGVVVAFFAARAADRRVAALRRAVRRLAGTTLASWRWTERDDLPGLTNELGAITTRLHERLEELTEGRDRAGQILDALDDGVLLLDGAGRLLIANPAARSWFGLPDDLRPGLPLKRVLGVPQVSALAEQAAEARAPVVGNLTLVFPEPRTLALRAFPLADHGPTGRIVVTMTDITQRRRLEVLRRDFVANASHELKTPVAAVRALAETLLTALPDDPEAGRRFAERIAREAERLDVLVRDLLDLSRVERGTLDVEPVDLVGLAKEIVGGYGDLAEERRIKLHSELRPQL
ncbi:MAG: histidine kinase dimerization/phospho-acceptor domain-containing protein, partial [Actinomycetes bacterium]